MAIKTAGTVVYMQSGALAAAKTITGISKANPAVVTCTDHGYTNGDIVKITGVVGMQQVNDRAFVVDGATDSPLTPNSFELKGVDSTLYTTYVSGGDAEKATMTAVGEVRDIPELGGTEPNEIEVPHLLSISIPKLAGLPRTSNVSFNVWFDLTTANHNTLLLANEDLEDRVFWFNKPASFHATMVVQVGAFRITGGDVNSAWSGTATLLLRGAVAWSTSA